MVSIKVRYAELEEEYVDKSIEAYSLVGINDWTLTFKVQFRDPSVISTDPLEPDYLDIQFVVPELIIDAWTGEPLRSYFASTSVACKP